MLILNLIVIAQISVPSECLELAKREGFSISMDKVEAKKAERRLAWLRIRYPFNDEIKACKAAVERMKG